MVVVRSYVSHYQGVIQLNAVTSASTSGICGCTSLIHRQIMPDRPNRNLIGADFTTIPTIPDDHIIHVYIYVYIYICIYIYILYMYILYIYIYMYIYI